MGKILKKNAQYIFYLHIFIYLIDREKCIYFRSFTHIIEFRMNIWWQLILIRSQIIIWSYLCDQNWWNIIKKNRYEFSSAFIDQCLPNMVQRLFADVIHYAIWLMNIHEQKYPWFLAMGYETGTNVTRTTKKTPLTTFMKGEEWHLFLSFLFKSDKFSDFFDIAG
jgi:hypothetical protein